MSFTLVELSEVAEIFNGKTPSKAEQRDKGFPVLKIKDISEHRKFKGIFESFVDESVALKSKSKFLRLNDTLILNAAHNADYVGSKQYRVEPEVVGCLPTGEWLLVRATAGNILDGIYLNFWLRSDFARHQIKTLVKGIHLYPKDVARLKIPLPPLPIQKQIAAVLEKADTLRQQCQQMEQELNALAQAVFLEMFGDPTKNTKGFKTSLLGNIAYVQIGPFGTMLHKSDYVTGGIPLINPTHISKSQIIPSYELTITKSKYLELPQYHLKEGDIIMGRRGEMGRCAIVTGKSAGYFCGTGSLFVRPNQQKVRSRFLNDFLSSAPVKRWFEEQSLGATMPNLNKGIVNNLSVPLPDLAEQLKYEHVLSNLSGRLENYRDLKAEIEHNFNSLMQRAFKGELDLTSNA
ncbi:restriction endonuclease subunit S [Rheinheimera sp. FR7-31]|uniref:restriction endonuclease subunit S n=1 Tax=Rheinheimera fenheensis TaxID=3152295 RepID=UPI00325CDFF6